MDERRSTLIVNDLTRRSVLAGAGAVALGGGLAAPSAQAQAAGTSHRLKVGDAEITILSDGQLSLPLGLMLPGKPETDVAALFAREGHTFGGLRSEINVTVVRIGREVILIDTGSGPDFMPSVGKLQDNMAAAAVDPASITKVVFTHAHADHLWGVIDPLGGDTLFEGADHVMTTTERDFWLTAGVESRVPDAFRGMAVGTQRRLKAIASRIRTVATETEVAPGVALIDTAGHTPGHASVLIRSGTEQLLIGGDVLNQPIISFAEPGWRWGPDLDGDRAAATRIRVLDRLATDRTRFLGYHLPWPGVGDVERKGMAFRFVPRS